ncbi:hypothetical protein HanIR_Chr02g0080121 [Helianthus annuus]|nr:hypothetical protein HanIR_Chr02g0080121 [Helianthus annuus]
MGFEGRRRLETTCCGCDTGGFFRGSEGQPFSSERKSQPCHVVGRFRGSFKDLMGDNGVGSFKGMRNTTGPPPWHAVAVALPPSVVTGCFLGREI